MGKLYILNSLQDIKELNEHGVKQLNISVKKDLIKYLEQIIESKVKINLHAQEPNQERNFFGILESIIAKKISPQNVNALVKQTVGINKQSIDLFFTKVYYGKIGEVNSLIISLIIPKDDNSKVQMKLHGIIIDNQPQLIIEINNISLEEQIQKLMNIDQYKDSLLATVAHDMRNPLNSVLYLIDESLQSSNLIEIYNNLTFSKVNGTLLTTLINDILDYCQSKQNKFRLSIAQFDLNSLIQETYQMMEISAKLQKVTLFLRNLLPKIFMVTSDRRRIQQVLINLIGNSVKFTPQGIVRLNVYQPPGSNLINFEVLDEGSGIPKEVQDQLGQPYMTYGSNTNQNSSGIGLGLNVCKIIISHLGPQKSFVISSKIGKGSKFSFQLYQHFQIELFQDKLFENIENENEIFSEFSSVNIRLDECAEQLSQKQEEIKISEPQIQTFDNLNKKTLQLPNSVHQRNSKILIVDDDGFSCLVIKKQLMKISEKFEIVEASNGQVAIEYFKEYNGPNTNNILESHENRTIKLIIMDSQMPIIGGFEACNQIKTLIKEEHYQDAIIIGCTGLLTDAESVKAKNVGMKDIIQKPLNLEFLQKIIEKYL